MRVPAGGRSVKEVGEFPLIEMLEGVVGGGKPARLELGIGDDAAVWSPPAGRKLVITTDMLVENVHFRLDWIEDFRDLGYKALAVNLSDIAAMGASPRLAFVDLGLQGSERDREVADLYRGMNALGRKFGAVVAGGDISSSPTGMIISVTVIGLAPPGGRPVLKRCAARPGDVLAVTGRLGLAAAGLRVLQRQLLTLDGRPAMVEAFHKPQPRVREGRLLVRCGVRAAMDLSDGLLGDLPKLCKLSGVSAVLDLPRLPIPNSMKWGFPDWFDLALRGGEDYELLFSAPPHVYQRVERSFRRAGLPRPFRIGEIVEAGAEGPQVRIRQASGRLEPVDPGAFTHFGS